MAEKKKYNSILISGRKDQTLTYSKYVKDEESGESVKESLDKKVNITDELTTQQIKDGAITNEKMAADSVGNTNLQDGSVSNEKMEDGSITNEKLAENSITKDKLKDNTIGVEKLDPELRQTINAATGLPENLIETIQNVDDTLKDHQSQLDDKQSQIDDNQHQITANDEDISLLQTRSTQIEETIKSIAATGGASQATAVTYNNDSSGLNALNAQHAIDEVSSMVIYDVSACNKGTVFESLQTLLSSSSLSTLIPTSVRHGGMSIRFIQGSVPSSDNKYVQYRLMLSTFTDAQFTNVNNWQGVEDESVAGSNNLLTSNGVFNASREFIVPTVFIKGSYNVKKTHTPLLTNKQYIIKNIGSTQTSFALLDSEDEIISGTTIYLDAGSESTYTPSVENYGIYTYAGGSYKILVENYLLDEKKNDFSIVFSKDIQVNYNGLDSTTVIFPVGARIIVYKLGIIVLDKTFAESTSYSIGTNSALYLNSNMVLTVSALYQIKKPVFILLMQPIGNSPITVFYNNQHNYDFPTSNSNTFVCNNKFELSKPSNSSTLTVTLKNGFRCIARYKEKDVDYTANEDTTFTLADGRSLLLYADGTVGQTYTYEIVGKFYRKEIASVLVNNYSNFDLSGDLIPIYNEKKIKEVSNNVQGNIDYPDYYKDYVETLSRSITDYKIEKQDTDGDNFIFITDTHSEFNAGYSGRLVRAMSNLTSNNKVIHGGDVGVAEKNASWGGLVGIQKSISLFNKNILSYVRDNVFLNIHGNHDYNNFYESGGSWSSFQGIDIAKVRNNIMLSNKGDIHFNENDNLGMYFYYDNPISKIRYIILDTEYDSAIGSSNLGAKQFGWFFSQAIMAAPEYYDFIVVSHIPLEQFVDVYGESGSQIADVLSVLQGINNKSTGSAWGRTYDFTNTTHRVIACFAGHEHRDMCTYVNNLLHIVTSCDARDSLLSPFDERYAMTLGTTQEQCFDNVVIFNEHKDIKCFRFGAGFNRLFHTNKNDMEVNETKDFSSYVELTPASWHNCDSVGSTISGSDDRWILSDTIISVNSNGVVTALTTGDAILYAQDSIGNKEFFYIHVE